MLRNVLDASIGPDVRVVPLSEATADDFKAVVGACFAPSATGIVDRLLSNPARSLTNEIGDIAYEGSEPVAVLGAVPCQLYFNQRPIIGSYGSLLALKPGHLPGALWAVLTRGRTVRGHADIEYANTCVEQAVRLHAAAGFQFCGSSAPAVWKFEHTRVLRRLPYLLYELHRRHPRVPVPTAANRQLPDEAESVFSSEGEEVRRLSDIDSQLFSDFWMRYLRTNVGLVSTRAPEILSWMFGSRLKNGQAVLVGVFRDGTLVGYGIACSQDLTARFWRIADCIALDNDLDVISLSLEGIVRWLRRRTPAFFVQAHGFPLRAQSVIERVFPRKCEMKSNPFILSLFDAELRIVCGDRGESLTGWFYGPYDGDYPF